MSQQAYFGKPATTFVPGGMHVAVYVVPVFEARLLVFDVTASAARGRWLPWDILDLGTSPYEAAATLVDDWCGGAVSDLSIADVMSFPYPGGGRELALIFRAELTALPIGDAVRKPVLFDAGEFDAIGNFDPIDLERWVHLHPAQPVTPRSAPVDTGLIF